jgi:hypothetical protein
MTFRQAIQRKTAKAMAVFVGSFVISFLCALLFKDSAYQWLWLIFTLILAGSAFYLAWLIDCPKCHVRLGQAVWPIAAPKLSLAPYKYCPFCGIGFDQHAPGL